MKPPNEKTPGACDSQGFGNQPTNDAIVNDAEMERNRFASLAARAAKAGHHLQKLGSGYILSKWGWVKHCCDLDGVDAALRQMGVSHGTH